MKKIKWFLFLVGVVLGVVVWELVFQVIYKGTVEENWQTTGVHRLDSELIYTLTPNFESYWTTDDFTEHARTNSQGFRNREITTKKPGSMRIVVVGDSFVYGHGISENELTFPSQLERVLQQKYPKREIEVINTGVKGYSPDQEYRLITTRLLILEPDLVVWEINPHDVYNIYSFPSLYDLSEEEQLIPTSARLNWLYLQGWYTQKAPAILKKSRIITAIMEFSPRIAWLNRARFIPDSNRLAWAQKKLTTELIYGSEFLKMNHTAIQVIIFPTKFSYINGEYKYPNESISQVLADISKEMILRKIPLYDVGEAIWKKYNKTKENDLLDLFFSNDYHFNEKGALLTADIVASLISL